MFSYDLKNTAGVDKSSFAKKVDLACMKLDVDKSNIGKLKAVPVDLSKLSDVVKNEAVKNIVYDEL